ncbi:MAG TPA: hypothetical protein DCL57_04170, partial [Microbacterium sp.]|nr:hypothetical protein [Microbacterium sp.]
PSGAAETARLTKGTPMSDLPVLDHWVGGAAWPGTSTRTAPVYDPARGEAQREVRLAGADDVAAAVASAT